MAFTPATGTDDPEGFFSCFFLGNIVNDVQREDTPLVDQNTVTFHDGRAIQLYAMGKLADGHSKDYITAHLGKISDFAREDSNVSEQGRNPDWYDGRVASLTGLLFCADDDTDSDGLSDTLPRASCSAGVSSLFPKGSVIDRITPYLRPCCVLSGAGSGETVDFFPCALQ
ncbi:hypothetical protein IPN35_03510 [Candidatus Peregrinibacteria bacterium]|nr:MAG: hypothetical protein IPN35_03510 [Candidatus Peregrinibacteria bacterium]